MSKHVLALEPQLAIEPPEREETLKFQAEELWSQEELVHARGENSIRPEESREHLQVMLAATDYKRLIL